MSRIRVDGNTLISPIVYFFAKSWGLLKNRCYLSGIMRRTSIAVTALLLLLSFSSMSMGVLADASASTPPSDGSSTTITADEIWADDAVFDGEVTIASGAKLTITSNISVADDAKIVVEDGGVLEMTNSNLTAQNAPTSLKLYAQDGRMQIPLNGQGGEVDISISFFQELTSFAPLVGISGETPEAVNGSEITIDYSSQSGEDNVWIDFTHNPNSIPVITSVAVNWVDDTTVLDAADLVQEGMYYCCAKTWTMEIQEGGIADMNSGSIVGANIIVSGNATADDSVIHMSGPVVVADTGSIAVINSTVNGSMDDEDIIAGWNSEIVWQDSTGTGGFVDHWIVVADEQIINTPLQSAGVLVSGLGWLGLTKQGSTDDSGNFSISMPERIISLQDSSGTMWYEAATVQMVWNGPWGNISTTVPLTPEEYSEINMDLPNLMVNTVSVNQTSVSVNKPVTVTVEVENAGLTSAEGVSLECIRTTGDDAYISPAYPEVSVNAGQVSQVEFTWRGSVEGDYGISCSILQPSDWLGEMSPSVDSEVVTWSALVNAEDGNGMVIALIAAAVIGVVLLGVMAQRGAFSDEDDDESQKEYLEEVEDEEEEGIIEDDVEDEEKTE
jgi:hypothetical protein